MRRLLLLLLLVSAPSTAARKPAAPAEAPADDVDPLALAARLIGDGYWDRAARVLSEVDPDTAEDLDRARFFTLRGLVRSREGLYEQAVEDYRAALVEEGVDPLVNLQLAQALIRTDRPQQALDALDAAGEGGAALSGTWLLRVQAHRALDDVDGAWVALMRGEARFPDELEFPRQRVFLLVQEGLYQTAVLEGRDLLERRPDDPTGWLAIAEALRNAGEVRETIVLLEEARMRFPTNVDVATLLARTYLQADAPMAAGQVLQVAAEQDPTLFAAASEAWRQAGDLDRSLYLNGRVVDPAEKAKQRLGIHLEQQDWARAAALEERLERLGLLRDEDALKYALAYAWFQLGELERAQARLRGITDPRWFKDATALREAMQGCEGGWGCR